MNNLAIILSEEELEQKTRTTVQEEIKKFLHESKEVTRKNNLSIDEAVAFLNSIGYKIKKSQLYKLTMNNDIVFGRFGRRVVFDTEDLAKWVESRKQKHTDIAGNVSRSAKLKVGR